MLRLKPPEFELDREVTWVLRHALSRTAPAEPGLDGARALELARRFGLSARIGARHSLERLAAQIGTEHAAELRGDHEVATARGMLLAHSARRVSEFGGAHGVPAVALKFSALQAGGYLRAGERDARDVDLLVPVSGAQKLYDALRKSGYGEGAGGSWPHQLAPLVDDDGTVIELHLHVPGVRLPGDARFARADDLIAAGLVILRQGLLVPSAPLLAAHAVAHALLQNFAKPAEHTVVRLLADLVDLRAASAGVVDRALAFLRPALDATDLRKLADSCRFVEDWGAGGMPLADTTLLRHLLAGQLDESYAARLRLHLLTDPFGEQPAPLRHFAALARALFPPPRDVAQIYGLPSRHGELLLRRVLRPLDLLGRGVHTLRLAAARNRQSWRATKPR